jgi:hypothetical protein
MILSLVGGEYFEMAKVIHYYVTDDSQTNHMPEDIKIWNRGTTRGEVLYSNINMGKHIVSLEKNKIGWKMTVFSRMKSKMKICYKKQIGMLNVPSAEKLALEIYKKWLEKPKKFWKKVLLFLVDKLRW